MIEVEILYDNLKTKSANIEDHKAVNNLKHDGVLAVRLIDGKTNKTITKEHSKSHYMLIHNLDNETNTTFLDSYETYEGKEFQTGNPSATNGYRRPFYPSFLVPFRTPRYYWIFDGQLTDNTTWDKATKIIGDW